MSVPRSGGSGAPRRCGSGGHLLRVGAAGLLVVLLATSCGGSSRTPAAAPHAPEGSAPDRTAAPVDPTAGATAASTLPVEVKGVATSTSAGAPAGAPTRAAGTGPGLTSLSVPRSARCVGQAFATLSIAWSFTDATSVLISVDAGAPEGPFSAAGSTTARFPCDGRPHAYAFRATGPGGSTTATATIHAN